jgi:Uma2 family endonuclease
MSAVFSEYQNISIVDFLNNGSNRRILLTGISWAEYESFLQTFWEKTNLSLAYNEGRLEIMPKSAKHEEYSRSIYNFFLAYCETFDFELESRGSTTFKRRFLEKGVEPDECFYITNANKIIESEFSTEDFPVPDVAVEIDITTDSLDKFPIYSALKVPEIWIYDGKKVTFNKLNGKKYHQISHSVALPMLSAEKLTEFLKLSQEKGQTFALKAFRKHLNEL